MFFIETERGKGYMRLFRLPFGIGKPFQSYSTYITKDEYRELMEYARRHNVKLENFKRFSGDISLIKEIIDDTAVIAKDFPELLTARKSVVIRLDETSPIDDFATTDRHLISINAKIFNDRNYLEKEYELLAQMGKFVKGTSYRSVIRHELGHVVANIYKLDPMEIAKSIFPQKSEFKILEYVHDNISQYAADYEDGTEFISECFSAYYGNTKIPFVVKYVKRCKELIKEGRQL